MTYGGPTECSALVYSFLQFQTEVCFDAGQLFSRFGAEEYIIEQKYLKTYA